MVKAAMGWAAEEGAVTAEAAEDLAAEGWAVMVVEVVEEMGAVEGSAVVGMGVAVDRGKVAQGGWEAAARVVVGVGATATAGCK